jgi:hypothetical protein
MNRRVAAFAAAVSAALLPSLASAAVGDPNPFAPPPPAPVQVAPAPPAAVDVQQVQAIAKQVVEDVLRQRALAAPPEQPREVPEDRTVGAMFIGCFNGVASWRDPAAPGALPGSAASGGQIPHGAPAAPAAPAASAAKFSTGVVFNATPKPPLRNPCAR